MSAAPPNPPASPSQRGDGGGAGVRLTLRRATFVSSDSTLLLVRRWSTAMPIVGAVLTATPACFSSSSVKPRPARTLLL